VGKSLDALPAAVLEGPLLLDLRRVVVHWFLHRAASAAAAPPSAATAVLINPASVPEPLVRAEPLGTPAVACAAPAEGGGEYFFTMSAAGGPTRWDSLTLVGTRAARLRDETPGCCASATRTGRCSLRQATTWAR
jgi:hypothetical protein